MAILDETDSGLDIDALRTVAEGVRKLHEEQGLGALIITHYQRILHYIEPQFVHILMDGRIVLQGGVELVERLEREGYDQIRQEVGEHQRGRERPVTTLADASRSSRAAIARRRSTTRCAGAGAGNGRTLEQLREAALKSYETSELPVWRRSGFWTTSLQSLDLDALENSVDRHGTDPEHSRARFRRSSRARCPTVRAPGGSCRATASVVHVELDPELAERGVILCSLEEAFQDHRELAERWYSKRLTIDRNKLEAANAAFWTGGAFLHVPQGRRRGGPVRDRLRDRRPRCGAVRAHARGRRREQRVQGARVRPRGGLRRPGAARGRVRAATSRTARAAASRRCRIGARARCTTYRRASSASDATRTATGCRRCSADTSCASTWSWRCQSPAATWRFAGCSSPRSTSTSTCSPSTCTRPARRGGDVHWRGAATGASRASFEGLIQIDPGAQQTHTYLQIHSMMLSPKARVDAIPSVLVSADDVSASHGGTVGELDEAAIFYMQSRGLDRPAAVRVIVEGFFEPLIAELADEPLEELVREKIAGKLAAARDDIEAYATSR